MTQTLINEKNQLRSYIASCLAQLPAEEKAKESEAICRALLKYIPAPSVVFGYYPTSDEVDIRPLLEGLLARHDHVFLPCVEGGRLVFREAKDLSNLCQGELGNQEPLPTAHAATGIPDIVLLPGRAFDERGFRLGRGGGMYDRWLRSHRRKNPDTLTLGLAFDCQVVEKITVEEHDERVTAVVTARLLARSPLDALFAQHRR